MFALARKVGWISFLQENGGDRRVFCAAMGRAQVAEGRRDRGSRSVTGGVLRRGGAWS